MDFSWITPALIVAILALWIAYFNFSRNNYVVIRMKDIQYSYQQNFDNRENGHYLAVTIQNLGIPIYNVKMKLTFNGKDGFGSCSFGMKLAGKEKQIDRGAFQKGMIGAFELRSSVLQPIDSKTLSGLTSFRKQRARIQIFSDDYLAYEFPLATRWTPFKRIWNRFANKLNSHQRVIGKSPEGHDMIKDYRWLPTFMSPGFELESFILYFGREHEPKAPEAGTT